MNEYGTVIKFYDTEITMIISKEESSMYYDINNNQHLPCIDLFTLIGKEIFMYNIPVGIIRDVKENNNQTISCTFKPYNWFAQNLIFNQYKLIMKIDMQNTAKYVKSIPVQLFIINIIDSIEQISS